MILIAHMAWILVGVMWFAATRAFHPSTELAVIVTSALVASFVVAADINHFVLIPRYWCSGRFLAYTLGLVLTMVGLTAIALTVIRLSYLHLCGPDPDPHGLYKHFGIDLFGVAVHVLLAAGVVRAWNRLSKRK